MRWQWIREGTVVKESPSVFFNEATCRNNAEINAPVNTEGLELSLERYVWTQPDPSYITQLLVRHLLYMGIKDLRDRNCEGCMFNAPGQKDHMDGGCLDDWENVVHLYLANLLPKVHEQSFRFWMRNIWDSLGYDVSTAESYLKSWESSYNLNALKEKLVDDNVPECYEFHFNSLKPTMDN